MTTNLQSMTGFGRGEAEDEQFRLVVEIKSVNNRFKDFRFRIPNLLNKHEMQFKSRISAVCKRGSFEVSVNLKKSKNSSSMKDIDFNKVNSFLDEFQKNITAPKSLEAKIDPTHFLRSEFFLELEDQEQSVAELALKAFDDAVSTLIVSRESEGEKLKTILESHVENYEKYFNLVKTKAPEFKEIIEQRLKERFKEYANELKIEEPRFMQEVIYYLEKVDIHEEINRIESHLSKFKSTLKSKIEVGREIEFMVQELNRETNTIGSKSSVLEISDNVVKMKVELEKLREQGLNLQ